MLTIGNLYVSLCRRCTVPTSLPLPPLHRRRALRARIPLAPYRTSSTMRSNSKLVVSGELKRFAMGRSDFSQIREPGLAYFDKTEYIPVLENQGDVQLVCRPRRFGKSLTVSMLQYFHGVEFRSRYDELFKGLDVDEAVQKGIVEPGRYLILDIDFSCVDRSGSMNQSAESLRGEINGGLTDFKLNYTEALGESFASETSNFIERDPARNLRQLVRAVNRALQGIHDRGEKDNPLWDAKGIYVLADEYDAYANEYMDPKIYVLADEYDAYANEYMDPHDPRPWSDAEPFGVLKSFWATVKASGSSKYGIRKVYITGVTPLLLSDLVSGANNQDNISFSPRISTICGLTRSDVLGALRVLCNNEEEVQKHLQELEHHANGYHFCQQRSVDPVFNTQTALSYLESVKLGETAPVNDPPNSEVSDHFLRICAGAPAAVNDMQFALQKDEYGSYQKIPCEKVLFSFKLSELSTQVGGEGDMSAWRSLLVYMGGLTFDSAEPSKFLKIPNLVAAKRFGKALLDRLGLYQSMGKALHTLAQTGNPMDVLAGYCHLMRQPDVIGDAFTKKEEHHRDSILITILENPAIKPVAEYEVRKRTTNDKGFVDLLITNNKNLYTLIEFKNIQISYLGLDGENITDKAKQLEAMGLNQILELKFQSDKWRSGTIRNWVDGGAVRTQLQDYIASPTVQKELVDKNFRAFAAVIVGSRQILVREMDRDGNWVKGFRLAGRIPALPTSRPDSSEHLVIDSGSLV